MVGVVKFPSTDQKFISEVNATNRIDSKMIDLSDRLWIVGPKSEGLPKYLNPEDVDSKYLAFSNYLFDLHEHLEKDGSFPDSGITLLDVIEGSDENASFPPSNIAMILPQLFQELLKEDFSCDPLTGKPQPMPKTEQFWRWIHRLYQLQREI